MKILIDMQGLQTPFSSKRGVGVYIAGLVGELHKLAGKHEISYLFNAEFPDEYFRCLERFQGIITRKNSHLFAQKISANYRFSSPDEVVLAEGLYTSFVEWLAPDVLFTPNLQEGLDDRAVSCFAASSGRFVQVGTLHDLVPLHLEAEYLADPATNDWYRSKLIDASNCDRIVTVSESSKKDIQRFLGVPADRIEAIPNAYDPDVYNASKSPREEEEVEHFLNSDRQYILYFGGSDHHKNLVRLVQAYARLATKVREQFSLVLAGRDIAAAATVAETIRKLGVEDSVLLPGFVDADLLPRLIRQARLFVFPSIHEGFGLPALEAMACGTATIGSATSSIAEVIDNREAQFDPLDSADIARVMARALEDDQWNSELSAAGLRRATYFSWQRAAAQLLAVMEEEHAKRVSGGALSFISTRLAKLRYRDRDLLERTARSVAESVQASTTRNKKIYLDASSVALHGGNSGIQRVVRAISTHLGRAPQMRDTQVEVVYSPNGDGGFRILSSIERDGSFQLDPDSDVLVDFKPSDILLFVDLQPGLAIRFEAEAQRLRARGVKVLYVVYDLLPVLMPEKFWPELQEEFYRWLQAVSRSDGLICISRTVAESAAKYLGEFGVRRPDPLPIDYFLLGSDLDAAVVSKGLPEDHEEIEAKLEGGQKFLMVGTLEPRKGHEQTIRAFEEAWTRGETWRLIIVGKQGWKMNRLALNVRQHPEFGSRLFWFERASDEWLKRLYGLSDCVICASEGEGFGLPLIEAANERKPVVARDIAVFREVAGDGAFYFPASTDPTVLYKALQDWSALHAARKHPDSALMQPMNWRAAAEGLASVLQKDDWHLHVRPRGAVDLRHPISNTNPNVRSAGFYPPENDFAWSTANGYFEFETAEDAQNVEVEFDLFSWKEMPFDVLIDDVVIHSATAVARPVSTTLSIPTVATGRHRIEFRSKDAGTPPNDGRTLGLGFRSMKMVQRDPVEPGEWVNARDARASWDGFSPVEFDWRWSLKKRTAIVFQFGEETRANLTIFGHAARPMEIIFHANGVEVAKRRVSSSTGTIEIRDVSVIAGANRIEFEIPDLRAFSDKDKRMLGLAVLDFKIIPVKILECAA